MNKLASKLNKARLAYDKVFETPDESFIACDSSGEHLIKAESNQVIIYNGIVYVGNHMYVVRENRACHKIIDRNNRVLLEKDFILAIVSEGDLAVYGERRTGKYGVCTIESEMNIVPPVYNLITAYEYNRDVIVFDCRNTLSNNLFIFKKNGSNYVRTQIMSTFSAYMVEEGVLEYKSNGSDIRLYSLKAGITSEVWCFSNNAVTGEKYKIIETEPNRLLVIYREIDISNLEDIGTSYRLSQEKREPVAKLKIKKESRIDYDKHTSGIHNRH